MNGAKSELDCEMILEALRCTNGEVRDNFRMIVFGYNGSEAKFIFYCVNEPDEDDREAAEIIGLNFGAGGGAGLEKLDLDFVVIEGSLATVDTLDAVIFRRWEPV
ncbi:MAG: hypothetical protein AAFR39_08230 [Pseudomonadota bacterium]